MLKIRTCKCTVYNFQVLKWLHFHKDIQQKRNARISNYSFFPDRSGCYRCFIAERVFVCICRLLGDKKVKLIQSELNRYRGIRPLHLLSFSHLLLIASPSFQRAESI